MSYNIKYSKSIDINECEYHLFDVKPNFKNAFAQNNGLQIKFSFRIYNLKQLERLIKEYNSTTNQGILRCDLFTLENNILYINSLDKNTLIDINISGRDNINKFLKELTDSIK